MVNSFIEIRTDSDTDNAEQEDNKEDETDYSKSEWK